MLNFGWLKRNKGQGMVEYILIVAVVIGIVFGAYKLMGGTVKQKFQDANKSISNESATTEKL
ncbi:MAG: hypothetical protein FWF00_06680 [Endomicrobia bacterium]|nr:hypothetical protein [Endomicrobiia bacterium]MCL2507349.1 hypothetical protein [Endomicrobiia bacterium]